jgi:hypothetical protein
VGMKPFRRGQMHEHDLGIFEKRFKTDQSLMWPPTKDLRRALYQLHSREDPRHIQPYLNWSWMCSWIAGIQRHQDCGNKLFNLPSLSRKLRDVLVIDVMHRCVVDLPLGAKHLALSYVWGANSEDQLQCTTANRNLLGKPGSLGDITRALPRTISDAISACAKLNHHSQIAEQLEQMAAIYHQDSLVMVSLEGDDATHGLPGVSKPRKVDQPALIYANRFGLVHETSSLYNCRSSSTWEKRGWTYQEYIASSVLLYFTHSGLYVDYWPKGERDGVTVAEGPRDDLKHVGREISGLHLIQNYSKRTLTYREDRLRGMSGVHQAMYEGRITFGIPLNDFENGITWEL